MTIPDGTGGEGLDVICSDCGGDGKETCHNPDHGFIDAMPGDMGRIGCPVCGHDPKCKVPKGGKCDSCNGTGKMKAQEVSHNEQ